MFVREEKNGIVLGHDDALYGSNVLINSLHWQILWVLSFSSTFMYLVTL